MAGRHSEKSLLRYLVDGIVTALLVAVLGLLTAMVVVPKVAGWTPLTVLTGSMQPTYPPGSQIYIDPIEPGDPRAESLAIGEVITFMPNPDDPTLVTHRIIGVTATNDGALYTTQGDNNDAPDPDKVGSHQVRGTVVYHLPHVGHVASWLDSGQKQVGTYVVAGALALYAVLQLVPRRRETADDASSQDLTDHSEQSAAADADHFSRKEDSEAALAVR